MGIFGQAHITSWDTKFATIPPQLQEAFSREEREVYETGASAILNRLRSLNEHDLIRMSQNFRANHAMHVYVDDVYDDPTIWFGLSSIKLTHQLRVCLPSTIGQQLSKKLPPRIRELYSVIGGVATEDPNFPKLIRPTLVESVALTETKFESYLPAVSFMTYSTGDFLCQSSHTEILFYDFHAKEFGRANLDIVLDEFFADVCKERVWGKRT